MAASWSVWEPSPRFIASLDAFSAAVGFRASSSAAVEGERSVAVGCQLRMVPTYPRVLRARGAVAALYWAAANPLMLVPYTARVGKLPATSSSSSRSQTAVPRPAQSHDSPFLPVRRLERNRKLPLQKARLQLGTATQHRLP